MAVKAKPKAPATHRQKPANGKPSSKSATVKPFAARDMLLAIAKKFESLPPGAWNQNRPRDMAMNLDHYLYGLPKEQDTRE